jgi:hypothetical protein
MRKFILLLSLSFLISGCTLVPKPTIQQNDNKVDNSANYTGSYYKGNYIWGGAMNLAWNELRDNIIKESIRLNTTDKTALETTKKLNNSVFGKADMEDKDYYVKSGFGQSTVEAINKESKEKFPTKSFTDLDIKLRPVDFISYAYFLKEVEYLFEFTKQEVNFLDSKVKGFYANSDEGRSNIQVLNYWNDDKFIISLSLKQNNDELILAKGFTMDNPEAIVQEINKYKNRSGIKDIDQFKMPEIHLNYNRVYTEMINKFFANKDWEDYFIAEMFENIKFDMDNKGARVENEAVIVGVFGAAGPIENEKPRNFILDKPFWVVMKQKDRPNPYFLLGVKNTEIMVK